MSCRQERSTSGEPDGGERGERYTHRPGVGAEAPADHAMQCRTRFGPEAGTNEGPTALPQRGTKRYPGDMTDIVLAAVSASLSCSPVLGFARLFATALDSRVCAIHVIEDHQSEMIGDLAFRAAAGLRVVDGDPVREILRAADHPDVALVVIGTHDLFNSPGPGHVTREIAMRLKGPVLVVPANAAVPVALTRILVPLEGTDETTDAISALLDRCAFGPETEIVTLHSFTIDDLPPFSDHEPHSSEAWVEAFRDVYVPDRARSTRLEMRCGNADRAVLEVADSIDATVIAVSWSQDLTDDHARVVNALLANPARATLLVPAGFGARRSPAGETAPSTPVTTSPQPAVTRHPRARGIPRLLGRNAAAGLRGVRTGGGGAR